MPREITRLNSRESVQLILTTVFVSSLGFLAANVINIAIPVVQSDFNLSLNQVQWFMNSYSLVLAVSILISGSLSDQLGQKKLLIIGLCLFIID